ncbi:TetR family transcriptional regulator [Thalassotalea insulae]|uniref:TetR family transcriptional regulator n=1 Tax=Thalassotalea insulae TaxID=2056778 RepID=A0ABQ6GQK8_9GAMM|nr:TetR/AcrR family transcriptional regulator [Thalassotalea insulae]GLX78255.1 TetR family transcriptional regulator [Thalassotalea insulae]
MPKKIDHDAYRIELAQNAIPLFSQYGYSGLGMRKIADELGISKSALYHYFPTKKALFHACTDLITQFDMPDNELAVANSSNGKLQQLMQIIKEIEPTFPGEMSLLFDYLRGRSPQDIAEDDSMCLANQRYEKLIAQFVSQEDNQPVLCLLMGTLLMRYFNGAQTDFSEIESWLSKKL